MSPRLPEKDTEPDELRLDTLFVHTTHHPLFLHVSAASRFPLRSKASVKSTQHLAAFTRVIGSLAAFSLQPHRRSDMFGKGPTLIRSPCREANTKGGFFSSSGQEVNIPVLFQASSSRCGPAAFLDLHDEIRQVTEASKQRGMFPLHQGSGRPSQRVPGRGTMLFLSSQSGEPGRCSAFTSASTLLAPNLRRFKLFESTWKTW
ncbi:uncharacterized protein LOC112161306 [Oryzias melastigma]|uniref:uncharacterized protein LOC112161306 n=1 Tax=Oryzias melastigma TaxID=30732 RepID=UPI00168CF666|nr:uncharacterized protein LOC112161306 [Oryzias melastigma]